MTARRPSPGDSAAAPEPPRIPFRGVHEIQYRPATFGLSPYGVPDNPVPGWHCTCGAWFFAGRPMATRLTGNNSIEAHRAHEAHVEREAAR